MKYEEAKTIVNLLIETQMIKDDEGDKNIIMQLLMDYIEKDNNGDYTVLKED